MLKMDKEKEYKQLLEEILRCGEFYPSAIEQNAPIRLDFEEWEARVIKVLGKTKEDFGK